MTPSEPHATLMSLRPEVAVTILEVGLLTGLDASSVWQRIRAGRLDVYGWTHGTPLILVGHLQELSRRGEL